MRSVFKTLGMIALMLFGAVALSAAPKPARPAPAGTNWNTVVTRTAQDTHILGNPAARIKLVEFISYTCPHCAHFEQQADAQLRLGFVANGKGSIEVRNFVRDPIDMTVALMTNCGPPSKFFMNHTAFLRSQEKWIVPYEDPSPAQRQRWFSGDFKTRTRAIATDFRFYDIMATRGYDRTTLDKCLADEALAKRLAKSTDDAVDKDFVQGTPSFMLDGVLLAGTNSWDVLRPQIEARLR
jgi:protein-disulfide isomerase